MQVISTIGLITINETLIVQLLSFLIFLFIINRVMFRPLRGVMEEREEYIENIRSDVLASGDKLKQLRAQIEQQEAEARREGFRVKEALEQEGSDQAEKLFAEAQREIAEMRLDTETEITRQVDAARQVMQQEAEGLATDIMEKILDRRLAS